MLTKQKIEDGISCMTGCGPLPEIAIIEFASARFTYAKACLLWNYITRNVELTEGCQMYRKHCKNVKQIHYVFKHSRLVSF